MSEWKKAREAAAHEVCQHIRPDGCLACPFNEDPAHAITRGCQAIASNAVSSALSAFESEGFVLVPKVATIDMDRAGQDVTVMHSWGPGGEYVGEGSPADIWEAMIAAALKDRT